MFFRDEGTHGLERGFGHHQRFTLAVQPRKTVHLPYRAERLLCPPRVNPALRYGCCEVEAQKGDAVAKAKMKVDCGMLERNNDSVEDILTDPELLRNKTLKEVQKLLGATPANWRVESLRRGGSKGKGWVLREYTRSGNETGRMIRYHPGGGRHGPEPYWRVMNSGVKSPIIPGASRPDRG